MIGIFAISDGVLTFWGAVLGGALGTLGAFSAAFITIRASINEQKEKERKEKAKKEKDEKKESLRQYNRQLIFCETSLNEYLPAMLKNIRSLGRCADASTPGNYMMTLPRTLYLSSEKTEEIRNSELVNQWLTLTIGARIINQLVEDFIEYYKKVRDTIMEMELKGQSLNARIVTQEHETLVSFAKDAQKAVQTTVDRAIETLAMLQLHGEKGRSLKEKFKDPKDLDKFVLNKKKVSARIEKLKKEFNLATIFQGV